MPLCTRLFPPVFHTNKQAKPTLVQVPGTGLLRVNQRGGDAWKSYNIINMGTLNIVGPVIVMNFL